MAVGGPLVKVAGANVSPTQSIAPDGRIELAFDRYLNPQSITRQTFILTDVSGNFLQPTVAYDPVARIVTITPNAPLQADQNYVITIAKPSSSADPNGLRAVDGATIDPGSTPIQFSVGGEGGAAQPAPPVVDFCNDVFPVFQQRCIAGACHASGPTPPAGLVLNTLQGLAMTAIGRVSQESNTGPRAQAQSPIHGFGIDMPILDTGTGGGGGNPGNSWLMYKLLMAVPPASDPTPPTCMGGGSPTDVSMAHLVTPVDVTADERASLSNFVLGREMPYPPNPGAPLDQNPSALTQDELERISLWIAQPAPASGVLPASCPCQ